MTDPQPPAPLVQYAHAQPAQGYPAPGYSGYSAPAPTTNGLATAGLILGIVAAVLAAIPLVGFFLFPLPALLALIFGIVGVVTASRANGLLRGRAIWAIGLSAATVPIAMIILLVLTAGLAAGPTSGGTSVSASGYAQSNAAE
jgi:hypothetical protein